MMYLDKWSVLMELYKAATQECRDSRKIIDDQIAVNSDRNLTDPINPKALKCNEMALRYRIAVEEEMDDFIKSTLVKQSFMKQ